MEKYFKHEKKKKKRKEKPEQSKLETLGGNKPIGSGITIKEKGGPDLSVAEYLHKKEVNEVVEEIRQENIEIKKSIYYSKPQVKYKPHKEKPGKTKHILKPQRRKEYGLKMNKFETIEENICYIVATYGGPITAPQIAEKLREIGWKTYLKTPSTTSQAVSNFWKYLSASDCKAIKRKVTRKGNRYKTANEYSLVEEGIDPEFIVLKMLEGKEKWKKVHKEAEQTIKALPDSKEKEERAEIEEELVRELQNEMIEIPSEEKRYGLVETIDIASSLLGLINKGLKISVSGGIDIKITIKIEK